MQSVYTFTLFTQSVDACQSAVSVSILSLFLFFSPLSSLMIDFLVEFEHYVLHFLSESIILHSLHIQQPGFTGGHPPYFHGGKTRQLKLPNANAVSIFKHPTKAN